MEQADQKLNQAEIKTIEAFMPREEFDADTRKAAIEIFTHAKDDEYSAQDYFRQLGDIIEHDAELGQIFLAILAEIAFSDDDLHHVEKDYLYAAATHLRLPIVMVENHIGEKQSNLSLHYSSLEYTPEMSDDEIKKAYRRKANNLHPDKLESKGLPKEFIHFAHYRCQN